MPQNGTQPVEGKWEGPQQQQQQQQQPSHEADGCLQAGKRPLCDKCRRPQRVCLCAALPDPPIQLAGKVAVLQHPHETKKKLATVPLLSHVLSPCSLLLLRGRRLRPKLFPAFDQLLEAAHAAAAPVLVLWPGPGVQSITDVALPQRDKKQQQQEQQTAGAQDHQKRQQWQYQPACLGQQLQQQQQHHQQQQLPSPQQQQPQQAQPQQRAGDCVDSRCASLAYVLVVVDGTWQHAKEMFDVLQPWLLGPAGLAVQVQLPLPPENTTKATTRRSSNDQAQQAQQNQPDPCSHQQQGNLPVDQCSAATAPGAACISAEAALSRLVLQPDPNCRLRTEPHEGCTTTYEAIAQAVSHLETQVQQQQQQPADQQQQHEFQAALLASLMRPLQLLTAQQARFSPAVRARTQEGGSAVVGTKARLGMSSSRLPAAGSAPAAK